MTPCCCLKPPLTKRSHQRWEAGGKRPPAHVAEITSLVAELEEEALPGQSRLLVLHSGLRDLSTPQLLGSPAGLTRVAGVVQQCWLGSPDGDRIAQQSNVTSSSPSRICAQPQSAPVRALLGPGLQHGLTLPHAGTALTPLVLSISCSVQRILNPCSASQSSKASSNHISAMTKTSNIKVSTKQKQNCPGLEAKHRSGQNPPPKNFHITNLPQRKR